MPISRFFNHIWAMKTRSVVSDELEASYEPTTSRWPAEQQDVGRAGD